MNRRQVMSSAMTFGTGLTLNALLPSWARSSALGLQPSLPTLSGSDIALTISRTRWTVDGRTGNAITINETIPAPLIRLKEGQRVRLAVTNRLEEDTSIHWHGVLVPFQFDGVPGVSFPGIRPGETFVYEFPIVQSGTYWYHSHSGLQEQMGHYGPIIIDPITPDPVVYEREHVIVLSDFSFMSPHMIMRKLKQQPGYFNFQKQTLAGLLAGEGQSLAERLQWGRMRMDPTDVSDVTGSTYEYLVNGHGPEDNWTALFGPRERVRLRFVNAAAMTAFNVRIPGLKLSVVQADGQNVRPVEVDEFQIAVAETFDAVIQPAEDRAFTLVAEAVDRSGMARATLAPRQGMSAPVPPLRERPLATMRDMGMGMDMRGGGQMSGGHAGKAGDAAGHSATSGSTSLAGDRPHSGGAKQNANSGGAHSGMSMAMRDPSNAPGVRMGPGVQMISPMPEDRTSEPGQGLGNAEHRVLVYADLVSLDPNPDPRPPQRTKEIHLTGNMERFMWSFDGEQFSDAKEPIAAFLKNERVRVTLVNDSMMSHPIHLHGHFFEVVNGHDGHHPRKHTVNVAPGGKVTFDLTADAPGDWAFHCHLLYHMHAGMFQVVTVRPLDQEEST
jgi:CopA family copper-resistance protein